MLEYLGKTVEVVIDRALGTCHPKFDLYYPINYGYIPNTKAGDGMEIDAYVLGVFKPIEKYEGVVIAVIQREDDAEDKLVVADELNKYNKDQIYALTEFTERFFISEIVCYEENN